MENKKIDLSLLNEQELQQVYRNMSIKVARHKAAMAVQQELATAPAGAAKYLRNLASGDALSLNNVIWPFAFVAEAPILAPGQTADTDFAVTQEAAFVLTEIVKVVFQVGVEEGDFFAEYLNPRDPSGNGDANGLRFALSDGSSSRAFMNDYVPLDQIGNPYQTFIPDRPMMFMPLQQLRINYSNENTTRSFKTFMIFKGYRLRLEGQQDLVNLVTAG